MTAVSNSPDPTRRWNATSLEEIVDMLAHKIRELRPAYESAKERWLASEPGDANALDFDQYKALRGEYENALESYFVCAERARFHRNPR